jgi:hypothetical protein
MKTVLLAVLALQTGCAAVAHETALPASPGTASAALSPTAERAGAADTASLAVEPSFATAGGHLTMKWPGDPSPVTTLWAVADAPFRWTRVTTLSNGGYAVVLRQSDTILLGALDAQRMPLGGLATVPARHVIGAPSVVAGNDVAIVAWAQGETTGCTSLMGTAFTPGETPEPVRRIPGTECTEERSARAPVLKQANDGRFVLAFTEIGVWSSQAVAMLIDARKQSVDGRVLLKKVGPASELVDAHELAERAVHDGRTAPREGFESTAMR